VTRRSVNPETIFRENLVKIRIPQSISDLNLTSPAASAV
jgi:hypothetical protein